MLDVLIVGAGMCGLTAAFHCKRLGMHNTRLIDAAPEGRQGPWRTFARMETLRSPKHLTGPASGMANLAFRAWWEGQYGEDGWERLGLIEYPTSAGDEEKVLEAALEAGAEDISSSDDGHEIWTAAEDLHEVSSALEKALGEAKEVKLAWKPNITVEMDAKGAGTLMKLIDTLEDDDDVQTVWGNYEIPDAVAESL